MSYEEWLGWEHDGVAEWINGEVRFSSVTYEHQRVLGFMNNVVGTFAQIFKLGRVYLLRYAMRVKPDGNGREPDLIFVANENLQRITERQLEGPADLVIEIISDDSVYNDRVDKFQEYEDGGVREYWIIDPRPLQRKRQRADFYVLDANGQYQPVPINPDGIYRSTVLPNFWLKVEWLWQDEPNPLVALAQIVGMEKLVAAMQTK